MPEFTPIPSLQEVIDAARRFAQAEREGTIQMDPVRARDSVGNTAIMLGEMDDEINSYMDPDNDIVYNRAQSSPSNFTEYQVDTQGLLQPIDILDENYTGYNFFNTDPELRRKAAAGPLHYDPRSQEFRDRLRELGAAQDVDIEDTDSLGRLAGAIAEADSPGLMDRAEDSNLPTVIRAMNRLNREGRPSGLERVPVARFQPNTVDNIIDSVNNLYTSARQVNDLARTRNILNRVRTEVIPNAIELQSAPIEDSTGQLSLPVNRGERPLLDQTINELQQMLESTPGESEEGDRIIRSRAVDAEDRIAAVRRRLTNPSTFESTQVTPEMLNYSPEAAQWLRRNGVSVNQIADEVTSERRLALSQENQERRRAQRLISDAYRMRGSGPPDLPERDPVYSMELPENTPENPTIPGLVEQLQNIKSEDYRKIEERNLAKERARAEAAKNNLRQVLSKYPEVERLLNTKPKSSLRPRVKGSAAKSILPYVDTQQMTSMPADRAALYNAIIADPNNDVDAAKAKALELAYSSGDTERQLNTIDTIKTLGYGEQLDAIQQPAGSLTRPVVGGGRYVNVYGSNIDPEAKALLERITTRNKEVNAALSQVKAEDIEALFPGRNSDNSWRINKLTLNLDKDTKAVTPTVGEEGRYGIRIESPAYSGGDLWLQEPTIDSRMSLNVLKYMADNPLLGERDINFKTKSPDSPGYTYGAKILPPEVSKAFGSFALRSATENIKPGTVIVNSPIESGDQLRARQREGLDPTESSALRKLQSFADRGMELPNLRAQAYQAAGFGPVSPLGQQYAYVDSEGNAVPLQPTTPDRTLKGVLGFDGPRRAPAQVLQDRLPLTSKAYFSLDPVMAAAKGLQDLAPAIRRTPSALLPGAADLIPSPEAVDTGFREGPAQMGKQMAREFVQSLPTAVGAAAILATPLAAPLAPGIGASMVGMAGAKAVNAVVRNTTGEGIVPKLRQAIGTKKRTRLASPPRTQPKITPAIRPMSPTQKKEAARRQNRNELQKRMDLVKERWNPAKGEFGLSEMLFGR